MTNKTPGTKGTFQIQNPEWQYAIQGTALASFRARAIAFMFDGLIVLLLGKLFESAGNEDKTAEHQLFSLSLSFGTFISAFIAIAYFSLATYWGKGATLGKRMMGIRVVSLTHHHLSLWHCIERALGYAASWLEAGFGFFQYFTHPNNQTVHDRIAETIVIKTKQSHELPVHEAQHPLRCHCGVVQGHVITSGALTRAICYCKDCQSFAHFLGKEKEVLDELGGTDIVPMSPRNVVFTQGKQSLACMQLSPKGLLRWYAKCCNTPIGNTWRNNHMAYVGLVHSCLEGSGKSIEDSFGPVRIYVNPKSAKGQVTAKSKGSIGMMLRWLGMMISERVSGNYKKSPFFGADGEPAALPVVIALEERQLLRERI
ncbi:MAG TPA: DUF6151 family protein [Steroidobacteraceae bacterium]|nr:DUF6151 family protein [Steroidobacteraceae bacterium]